MIKFYLLPIDTIDNGGKNKRGPKYILWSPSPPGFVEHPGIVLTRWGMMDYGFVPSALLCAPEIIQTDHDSLVANIDVYAFPDNLDLPVTDLTIDTFFEAINIPTDWLTPATTYRELMRQTAGMFQFNQRYSGISGGASIFDTADLDTRLRQMTEQEQTWFLATVDSFGFDSSQVNTNAKLRQLVKTAGSFWTDQSFYLAGVEF